MFHKVRATVAKTHDENNTRIEKGNLQWKEVELDVYDVTGEDVLMKAGSQIFCEGYTFDDIEVVT